MRVKCPWRRSSPLLDGSAGLSTSSDAPSAFFLVAINSFAFTYSLIVCTLGVVVLPEEAVRLFRESHAMMLGVMLGCTGVTQLISPIVGYVSDRSTSRHGRRRPLLITGAMVACAGCMAMLMARERLLRYAYIGALTCAIAGMNISYACYTALLPDLIPVAHMGRASGSMAMMSMLGALLGFSLFGFWLPTAQAYAIYCIVNVFSVTITCLVAHEQPGARKPINAASCSELLASYSIDAHSHPDFFWVFVTRTFYYMCISLQAFVLFMLRDVQGVDNPTYYTSVLAMIGQISAAIVAIPSGHLSDLYGRKPLVYAACGFMVVRVRTAVGAMRRAPSTKASPEPKPVSPSLWGSHALFPFCLPSLPPDPPRAPAAVQLVYLGFACSPSIRSVLMLGVAYGLGNGELLLNAPLPEAKPHPHRPMWRVDDGLSP